MEGLIMKIEDKKFLAEWMGNVKLVPNSQGYLLREVPHFKLGLPSTQRVVWNPKTSPEDFKEVLEKFELMKPTNKQYSKMDEVFIGSPDLSAHFSSYLWVCNNMPRIIKNIVEVLKEGG